MLKRLSGLFALKTAVTSNGPNTTRSVAMSSIPGAETAAFANGCFWGTEHMFDKYFAKKGLLKATVGYVGGKTSTPSYRQVCSGSTGHAEACKLEFDPSQVSYAELVEFFYRSHDPTQKNGQGPDRGSQYRSVIVAYSEEQMEIAKRVTAEVQEKHFDPQGKKIVTEFIHIKDTQWYDAEDYHQHYLHDNPGGYECPTHRLWW